MKQNRFVPAELPLHVRQDRTRRAEVAVYDALKEQLNLHQRDWVVIWSARWMSKPDARSAPRTGEADFLLAHPKRGLIVAEVKGGRIEHRSGQWYSVDGEGQSHAIDPFVQVERNAYELARKFDQLRRWTSSSREKYARWIIFPDSAMPINCLFPTDYANEMVTDALGMATIVEGLLSASAFWYGDSWMHPAALKAPSLLLELFDEPIQFTMPLAVKAGHDAQEFERLTDSQFRVISAVAGCPRVAVAGGAGSGKTWLARKRAVQLAAEGFRVLLTCKSNRLASFLQQQTAQHDDLIICAYSELLQRLQEVPQTVEKEAYGWKLVDFIGEHADLAFDAVLVDEGQDFSESEWEFVECLLGPEKQGIFYVFYDDNQQLNQHETKLPAAMVPLYLEDNVRTTRTIHQDMISMYRGLKPQRPQGPLGRSVERLKSGGKLGTCIRQVIARLLKNDRFEPKDIVVLTPVDTNLSQLANLSLADGRMVCERPRSERDVLLASINDFKGLENAVVIVAELDRLPESPEECRRLMYTALSRPRSHLVLVDFELLNVGDGL